MKRWMFVVSLSVVLGACGGSGSGVGGVPPDDQLSEAELRALTAGVWIGEATLEGGAAYGLMSLSYDDRFLTTQIGGLFYDSRYEVLEQGEIDGELVVHAQSEAPIYFLNERVEGTVAMETVSIPQDTILGTFEDSLGQVGVFTLAFSPANGFDGALSEIVGTWGHGAPTGTQLTVTADGSFSGYAFGGCQLNGTLDALEDVVIGLFGLELEITGCSDPDENGSLDGLAAVTTDNVVEVPEFIFLGANDARSFAMKFGPLQ